nr:recombinase family protein [Rhizobium sp. Khangiran2]
MAMGKQTAWGQIESQDSPEVWREIGSQVTIAPSADGRSPDLTIYGRLAAVLASMQAFQEYTTSLRAQHTNEHARRVWTGESEEQSEKLAYLNRCQAILAEKEADWLGFGLPVLLVAGA